MEQKGNKKALLAVAALVAAVLILGGVYVFTRPAVSKGDKHIVVEVVHADGASKEYEYDTDEEDPIVPLSDREFEVLGSTNLEDLCEELDLNFTSEDYDTIGGYLIGLLDHLPEKNEIIITDDDVLLRVDQMDKNRIEKIYIKKPVVRTEGADEEQTK